MNNRDVAELNRLQRIEARIRHLAEKGPEGFRGHFRQKIKRLDFLRAIKDGKLPCH